MLLQTSGLYLCLQMALYTGLDWCWSGHGGERSGSTTFLSEEVCWFWSSSAVFPMIISSGHLLLGSGPPFGHIWRSSDQHLSGPQQDTAASLPLEDVGCVAAQMNSNLSLLMLLLICSLCNFSTRGFLSCRSKIKGISKLILPSICKVTEI